MVRREMITSLTVDAFLHMEMIMGLVFTYANLLYERYSDVMLDLILNFRYNSGHNKI